ncbi:heterokaryon incompatibility protein [Rutstroemia sp. NJR-2017a BVV2]|nr:heterokaryon incompatibility protein [Rutstroemia sp. NJR-2017a BVV2]
MARAWLETCSREHTLCEANYEDGFLPTRLIDIGNSPNGAINPCLVITNDVERNRIPKDTRYLALSHCWGTNRGKTVPKTTTANLTAHLDSIETNTIPKTFSDAMEVVRRLGLRYIWIDSLCIIQDDKKDFEVECSRMHRIYSQAHCTIVVSGKHTRLSISIVYQLTAIQASDSPDSNGGCFIPRNSGSALRKFCKFTAYNKHSTYRATSLMDPLIGSSRNGPEQAEVTIYPHFGPWVKGIQRGSVFTRGWCLQEREMSPKILHFTRERLLWECRQCVASEDKPQLELKQDANKKLAAHLSNFRLLDDNDNYTYSKSKNGVVKKSHKWEKLVEAYSKRALSVVTDKLPAISGIAASLALRQPDDVYLAGLWRSNLLEGISWFPRKPPEPPILSSSEWPPTSVDPGIPSWSWAAHSGPIMFCGQTWFSSSFVRGTDKDGKEGWVKSKLETNIESVSVNHDSADAFGRVSEGELALVGWAAELTLIEDDVIPRSHGTHDEGNVHFSSKCYSRLVDNSGATIYFDNEVDTLPETRFLCLQLGTGKNARATCSNADVGLVLLRVSSNDDAYRRVGMFDISINYTGWHTIREKRRVRII